MVVLKIEMHPILLKVEKEVFIPLKMEISDFQFEQESTEYEACRFSLAGLSIISRKAKITPKKVGQFVTLWKRNKKGIIEPFDESDPIDYLIINLNFNHRFGQFVFPKSVLIKKGIISTQRKEGKRAFRIYPKWDKAISKQAERSQKWQLDYFYELEEGMDLKRISDLLQENQL